jgi:23S rRNA (cytosine1962-C5)-methyltransferase
VKPERSRTAAARAPGAARLRLRITAGAETIVRGGHPWIFADSVRDQNRPGAAGELAVIFDRKDRFLAVGFFDPESPIRVRILHAGKPLTIDAGFWRARLDAALKHREGLFDGRTTGYRLINGESDGWPGLALDRYDATLVLKIDTAAWLSRLDEIVALIRERLPGRELVFRCSRNIEAEAGGGSARFSRSQSAGGRAPVVFLETGLRFEADVVRGQKTGFFLDQRENRRIVESLARGRAVLNAFSFSGGFSLYAARGGAVSVADLDLSRHALESAGRNFALNQNEPSVARCRHETIQADAFEWLAGNPGRRFDLVILDPPSLARRESERAGAIRAYARLAGDGIRHLSPGGILVACSCSAHVSVDEFFHAVRSAAARSDRQFSELQTTRHAPDHPACFKEAGYLKGIFLRFVD